jgi:acyl carrier protein
VSASRDDVERVVVATLGIEDADEVARRPLGELGIDSLTAAELSATIEDELGLIVAMERFFGDETLAEVLSAVDGERDGASS